MSKAVVQAGQNIGDIAVQYCGSHEAVFEIARLNNLSVTDEVAAGVEILIPDVYDKRVRRFYVEGGYFPATSDEISELEGGIGFWTIGVDFCVGDSVDVGNDGIGEMIIETDFEVR